MSILDRDRRHKFVEIPDNSHNSFIWNINKLAARIRDIIELNQRLPTREEIEKLLWLADIDLDLIIDDLKKGIGENGTRKLDISVDQEVVKITVKYTNGASYSKECDSSYGPIVTAASLSDQFRYWDDVTSTWGGTVYSIVNTSLLRFADSSDNYSLLYSVTLTYADGSSKTITWDDTTSAILSAPYAGLYAKKAAVSEAEAKTAASEAEDSAEIAYDEAEKARKCAEVACACADRAEQAELIVRELTNAATAARDLAIEKANAAAASADSAAIYAKNAKDRQLEAEGFRDSAKKYYLLSEYYSIISSIEADRADDAADRAQNAVTEKLTELILSTGLRDENLTLTCQKQTIHLFDIENKASSNIITQLLSIARLALTEMKHTLQTAKDYIASQIVFSYPIVALRMSDGTSVDSTDIFFITEAGEEIPQTNVRISKIS